MKFAYADPPYLGYGKFYTEHHPDALDWDDQAEHQRLIDRLCDEYPDGWALSMTTGNLFDILPMVPRKARIGAWVKPFCSFKKNVSPAYAWEPVVFMGGRKHETTDPPVRDWVAENITLKRGLVGAKPRGFCRWVFDLLNARPGDTMDDIFPGSGAVGAAWAEWSGEKAPMPQLPLEALMQPR